MIKSIKEMQEKAIDTTKPGMVNTIEMLRLEALTSLESIQNLCLKPNTILHI